MDRFEILEEPTGKFSIFDTLTGLPVTVEGQTFIGMYRHQVPLALLTVNDALRPANWSVLPSLSVLGPALAGARAGDLQA
ncbi:hypothetical protein [Mesorhizobium sp. INR15]|uniref:hypothetical protein n=1 Tax=Mesorhizobium sp. INR15 TaxID=2654248 RepID=UPI001896552F|nr:hypothetical protein [Mesorhizobium sp. INR15]QPC91723.1 hypothetical protein GA829_14595 [Mesorhizobium sp. INR15]